MNVIQVSNTAAATTAMLLTVSFYVIATTLPATVVYVLEESFPLGSVHLTDAEIAVDDCWQRYFRYLTVRRITEEVRPGHFHRYLFLRQRGGGYVVVFSCLSVCHSVIL